MGAIIPSAGSGMMPRQGVAKEKIVDIEVIAIETTYNGWQNDLEEKITDCIERGYQPMPNTYCMNKNQASLLMIKTKMEVEMI